MTRRRFYSNPHSIPGVAEREAADRFLANELAVLRIIAISSDSPVPGRLYLGIEECFGKSVVELGRLHAQGGPAMAEKGRALLSQIGLLN